MFREVLGGGSGVVRESFEETCRFILRIYNVVFIYCFVFRNWVGICLVMLVGSRVNVSDLVYIILREFTVFIVFFI